MRPIAWLALLLLTAACSPQRVQTVEGSGGSTDGAGESTDSEGSSTDGEGSSSGGPGQSQDPVDCGALDASGTEPTEYRQVEAAQRTICALTGIGSVRCWSTADLFETDPEPISDRCFRRIALGGGWGGEDFVCGLDEAGQPHCSTTATGSVAETPALALTSLVAGGDFACGLDDEGSATCWWVDAGSPSDYNIEATEGLIAGGPYEQIVAGWEVACGLSRAGEIACFGQNRYGEASSVPTGTFDRVFAFGLSVCALDATGALQCWGEITETGFGAEPPVVGPGDPAIVDVSGDLYGLCWQSADRTIECDGSTPYDGASGGPFDQIDGGLSAICGLEPDGGLVCTIADDAEWTPLE